MFILHYTICTYKYILATHTTQVHVKTNFNINLYRCEKKKRSINQIAENQQTESELRLILSYFCAWNRF